MATGSLNAHDRRLVRYVDEHPGVALAALASALGVRERTVFSYLKHANEALGTVATISYRRNGARGAGYYLAVSDDEAYRALMLDGEVASALPQTPAERVDYLLYDLLSRVDWITLDALSEMLYVSRTTLSGDLRAVEDKLARFGLTLEKRPHYGMLVTGSEMARRLCLADITLGKVGQGSAQRPLGVLPEEGAFSQATGHESLLEEVATCVDEALTAEGFQVNALVYRNLLVHICIALARIRSGHYVPQEGLDTPALRAQAAWPVACAVARAIERAFSCILPEAEVAYIAIHLAGKRVLDGKVDEEELGIAISDEVWGVVSQMLELVYTDFHFDFRSDLELRMNLARHIVPLAARLRHHLPMGNPILEDTKRRYPLAFSMAVDTAHILARVFGAMPSEEEIGYIALAFALAIERHKTEVSRKNILIVCASGQGSARLLAYRYREEFGAYLNRVETCDVSQVDTVDLTAIDYVFTTVPLGRALPVPVREVGLFLDEADIARVRAVMRGECAVRPDDLVLAHLDPRMFHAHLSFSSKEEVLDMLCAEAAELHAVDDSFRDLVYQREELAPTAFGNRVALPHPLAPASDETFFGVGLLDVPILWNGHEVQAVFFLSIARGAHDGLDRFFDRLSDVLMSAPAITRLVSDQRLETLMEIFQAIPPQKGDQS